MVAFFKHRLATPFVLLALLLLAVLVYLPGINGPFLFDDAHNILTSELVRMEQLDLAQLLDAAYSAGGHLPSRGLARSTFALNYYFSGARYDSADFKLTNIFIHVLNAVLVFMLAKALFSQRDGAASRVRTKWVALFAAAVWLLHPLQLTSVLYIVQRMTSMSALFVFAGLLVYVHGRARVQRGERGGLLLMAVGLCAGTALGLLSKETAALLPFLAYVVHLAFFPTAALGQTIQRQLRVFHLLFVGLAAVVAIIGIAWFWSGFVASFEQLREFTMGERVLTQSRVLFLYLSLLVFPSLRQLSLHHDEFVTSTSLLSPPSSLLALTVLVLIVALALYRLRSGAMWAFAVVFFIVGQSMESSFLPLEMVHEHRNYLPSFALAMLCAHSLERLSGAATRPMLMAGLIAISVICALSVVTWARVGIWSNARTLAEYTSEQHPDSYRSLAMLATVQVQQGGTVHDLFATYRHLAQINKVAIFPLIRMRRVVAAMRFHLERGAFTGAPPAPAAVLAAGGWGPPLLYLDERHLTLVAKALTAEVLRRLSLAPLSAETLGAFEETRRCTEALDDECVGLGDEMLEWLQAALTYATTSDRSRASLLGIVAYYEALAGHFEKASAALQQAQTYKASGEPYIVMRQVLLLGQQRRFGEAESLLATLLAGRGYTRIDRRRIAVVQTRLERMREQAMVNPDAAPHTGQPER